LFQFHESSIKPQEKCVKIKSKFLKVNPPFYVPLVELVPAPWTSPEVAIKARQIMEELGQKPVSLSREIPGFALNRIQ
jgi:3-hydroxyacyl-CoA dehydrogenase